MHAVRLARALALLILVACFMPPTSSSQTDLRGERTSPDATVASFAVFPNTTTPNITTQTTTTAPAHTSSQPAPDTATPAGNGSQCLFDLINMLQHLSNNSDHLRMLDAWGRPGSGILEGNLYWYGAYDECRALPTNISRYCMLKAPVEVQGRPAALDLGMCVPPSCSDDSLPLALISGEAILQQYIDRVSPGVRLPSLPVNTTVTCQPRPTITTDPGALAVACFIGFLAFLVVLATVIDLYRNRDRAGVDPYTLLTMETLDGKVSKAPLLVNEAQVRVRAGPAATAGAGTLPKDERPHEAFLLQILGCFSLYRNLPKLLSTKAGSGTITSLNGIRVFSMGWVLLGHVYFWQELSGTDNLVSALRMFSNFEFAMVDNAFFSVDSFFFLSGLLVCLGLIGILESGRRLPWLKVYLHRWLRLAPALGVVLLVWARLLPYLGSGPDWTGTPDASCARDWWANMVFVNNFYPQDGTTSCADWTWYLAVDWNFYAITPFLVLVLHYNRKLGFALVAAVFVACSVVTVYLTYHYDIGSTVMRGGPLYFKYLYIKPWARIGPYLVGLVTAVLLRDVETKTRTTGWRLRLPRCVVLLLLFLALSIGFLCLFGTNGDLGAPWIDGPMTPLGTAMYNALSRTAWGTMLGILVFLCHTGHGGVVNTILSADVFTVLQRLTYSAYLLHPIVITVYMDSKGRPNHFATSASMVEFFGVLTIVYLGAAVLALGVEFPAAQLEKLLFFPAKRRAWV